MIRGFVWALIRRSDRGVTADTEVLVGGEGLQVLFLTQVNWVMSSYGMRSCFLLGPLSGLSSAAGYAGSALCKYSRAVRPCRRVEGGLAKVGAFCSCWGEILGSASSAALKENAFHF